MKFMRKTHPAPPPEPLPVSDIHWRIQYDGIQYRNSSIVTVSDVGVFTKGRVSFGGFNKKLEEVKVEEVKEEEGDEEMDQEINKLETPLYAPKAKKRDFLETLPDKYEIREKKKSPKIEKKSARGKKGGGMFLMMFC